MQITVDIPSDNIPHIGVELPGNHSSNHHHHAAFLTHE